MRIGYFPETGGQSRRPEGEQPSGMQVVHWQDFPEEWRNSLSENPAVGVVFILDREVEIQLFEDKFGIEFGISDASQTLLQVQKPKRIDMVAAFEILRGDTPRRFSLMVGLHAEVGDEALVEPVVIPCALTTVTEFLKGIPSDSEWAPYSGPTILPVSN